MPSRWCGFDSRWSLRAECRSGLQERSLTRTIDVLVVYSSVPMWQLHPVMVMVCKTVEVGATPTCHSGWARLGDASSIRSDPRCLAGMPGDAPVDGFRLWSSKPRDWVRFPGGAPYLSSARHHTGRDVVSWQAVGAQHQARQTQCGRRRVLVGMPANHQASRPCRRVARTVALPINRRLATIGTRRPGGWFSSTEKTYAPVAQ